MKLKNKSINEYSMYKLSKLDNDFSIAELDKIDELVVNNKTIVNDREEFSFYELYKFNNIKKITFRFFNIYEEDLLILNHFKKLNDITFDNCGFKNIDIPFKINSLSLINCEVDINTIINNNTLEYLTIINNDINFNIINKFNNLKYLNVSNCKLSGNIQLSNIEVLHIDNTNIKDFTFIKNLNNLRKLTIDKYQYNNSKEVIDNLDIEINIVDRGALNE